MSADGKTFFRVLMRTQDGKAFENVEWRAFNDQKKTNKMNETVKNAASRTELKERIIETAMRLFTDNGIRSITMDEIAASLGISKRTLYEIFVDKEALLEECIRRGQDENDAYLRSVQATARNVLEVLLKCYQRSIEKYHATNRLFFEDIKKYPKAYELMTRRQDMDSEHVINFFREGVRQGIFRSDVHFGIINFLLHKQLDVLMHTDISERFSFLEVYEAIVFTCIRGISTEKGARELDEFIDRYRAALMKEEEDRA